MILKLHGAIDRRDFKQDSYVITEDSYIDYLVGGDLGADIPVSLLERMADSHFLFLGYSMHDWNLRVILNRIWGGQQLDLKSWACSVPRPMQASAKSRRRCGGAAATSTSFMSPSRSTPRISERPGVFGSATSA